MNTVPGISSRHGIYPASPEAMEKGKETETGEKPMEMEGMTGGVVFHLQQQKGVPFQSRQQDTMQV